METDRLKYFCTIAEIGSLTAAAEILNVSHSGLSKAMSVLQTELGQQLFRPLGRGLELTEAGRNVYLKSKEVLDVVEKLKKPGAELQASRIRIGMTEVLALALTGEITEALYSSHAHVDFYDLDAGEAEVKILEGHLDFALSFVPFPHADLEYLKIKKASMGVFYCNPSFKNKNLNEIPFVVPNSEMKSNPLSVKSRDGWPTEVERLCVFGASNLSLALKIVEAGSAAVFIPKFLAGKNLVEYETKKSLFQSSERDIFLVKKKNIEESKVMKTVAKLVRTIC
jgi:DNA-binding transcriptional LysR family regulator